MSAGLPWAVAASVGGKARVNMTGWHCSTPSSSQIAARASCSRLRTSGTPWRARAAAGALSCRTAFAPIAMLSLIRLSFHRLVRPPDRPAQTWAGRIRPNAGIGCRPRWLPDDVDDPLHAEPGVVTAVLGLHEAGQDVPAAVVADDELLVGTVRQRPGEGAEPGGVPLGEALPTLVQVPGDLAGLPVASRGRVDDHVNEEPVVGEPDQLALVQRAGAA